MTETTNNNKKYCIIHKVKQNHKSYIIASSQKKNDSIEKTVEYTLSKQA